MGTDLVKGIENIFDVAKDNGGRAQELYSCQYH
jgi:hypothetical protein